VFQRNVERYLTLDRPHPHKYKGGLTMEDILVDIESEILTTSGITEVCRYGVESLKNFFMAFDPKSTGIETCETILHGINAIKDQLDRVEEKVIVARSLKAA
jgi:hypothetical protein